MLRKHGGSRNAIRALASLLSCLSLSVYAAAARLYVLRPHIPSHSWPQCSLLGVVFIPRWLLDCYLNAWRFQNCSQGTICPLCQGFTDVSPWGIFRQWLPLGDPLVTNQYVTAHIQTRDHLNSTHCHSSQDKLTRGALFRPSLLYWKWEMSQSPGWFQSIASWCPPDRPSGCWVTVSPTSGPMPLWVLLEVFPYPAQGC